MALRSLSGKTGAGGMNKEQIKELIEDLRSGSKEDFETGDWKLFPEEIEEIILALESILKE
jgi:hypothetical protein